MGHLSLRNLTFAYGERPVLGPLTLDLPARSLVGVVGPNGCGKSTLVSLLARLSRPAAGEVTLDGVSLAAYTRRDLARRIAYLPQHPVCPRGITVEQVLRYGRHPHQSLLRQFSRDDAHRIDEVAQRLQLTPFLRRPMEELSGGQRQKAWLGMALVQDTDVLLLDEPTSALDIGHQHEVLACVRAACDAGKTVVLVIHDLGAAARFCDELLALKAGIVRAFGPPDSVVTPALLLDLYGVHAEILRAPGAGTPVIVPVSLQAGGPPA